MFAKSACMSLVLVTFITIINAQTHVTGVVGKSVRLPCDLARSTPPNVRWVDWVYNSGRDPQLIYTTVNAVDKSIDANHPNRDNMIINDDLSLNISRLKLAGAISDAGEYICISTVDGIETEQVFVVDIGGLPTCSGGLSLSEGDTSLLTCEAPYSGSAPKLTWYMGDEEVQSLDMNDINLAKREYTIAGASYKQDAKTFTCKMSLGEFTEECSLKMSVTYKVRDLIIMPESDTIRVNEEIKCSALGNPKPTIDLKVTTEGDAMVTLEDGGTYKSFVVAQDLQGQKVTVSCSASNTAFGILETLNKQVTYTVIALPTTTTTTTTIKPTVIEVKTLPPATNDKEHKEPPPTPKPEEKNPGPKDASGNVVGIVAGIVIAALVIVVIVIAIVCIRRKNSKKHKGAQPVPTKEEEVKRLEDGKA